MEINEIVYPTDQSIFGIYLFSFSLSLFIHSTRDKIPFCFYHLLRDWVTYAPLVRFASMIAERSLTDRRGAKRRKWLEHNPPPRSLQAKLFERRGLGVRFLRSRLAFRPWLAQDPEVAVRCGPPIKTSINNINCRPTPGRNRLPRSKGTVEAGRRRRVAFNQYPRNAADG